MTTTTTTTTATAATTADPTLTPTYLLPSEVAVRFRVDPKTVTRWAKQGKLPSIRTLGGHRRYPADAVDKLLAADQQQSGTVTAAAIGGEG